MYSLDIFIQNYFSLIRTPLLTEFMYLVSNMFDLSLEFVLVSIFITLLVYLVRSLRHAILFVFSLFATTVVVYFLKIYFDVSRPSDSVVFALGQSFPSYHATISTVFFLILIYIFSTYPRKLVRIIFITFSIGMIILVAFSRVYLGAHWFSDVVSGVILGGVISYVLIYIFNSRKNMHTTSSMIK